MVPSRHSRYLKVKYYKKHKKIGIILWLLTVIVFSMLLFNISDIASSIITRKGSLFYRDRIKISSYCVYGVSAGDYNSEDKANAYSSEVKAAGGMGQVYKSGEYYVLAQIYPTLLEATEVQENLLSKGYNAKVVTISVPQIDMTYTGQNKEQAESAFGEFRRAYTRCYELGIKLDKNEISCLVLQSSVASLLAENENIKNSLSSLGLPQNKEQILSFHLGNLSSILRGIVYFEQTGNNFSSFFKTQLFLIVQENITLSQDLA